LRSSGAQRWQLAPPNDTAWLTGQRTYRKGQNEFYDEVFIHRRGTYLDNWKQVNVPSEFLRLWRSVLGPEDITKQDVYFEVMIDF